MRRLAVTISTIVFLTAPTDLSAQRLTVDVGGAAATPTKKLSDANLSTGFGFDATIAWRLVPHLHLYGGWTWMRFSASQLFVGTDRDIDETGYAFGLRFEHPFGETSRMLYRFEGGGTYRHIEIENSGGTITTDSGHGLGFELGAGVLLPLADSWRLAPALRYRALSREVTIRGRTTGSDLRYAALEIGISRRF
jgi:hypothetical protein